MKASKPWTGLALALIAACACAPAWAGREAIETSANDVVMPSTPDGTIVLKPCSTCAPVSVRVTPQSRYFIRGREVTLQDMILQSKDPEGMLLVVSYDPKTRELASIRGWQ